LEGSFGKLQWAPTAFVRRETSATPGIAESTKWSLTKSLTQIIEYFQGEDWICSELNYEKIHLSFDSHLIKLPAKIFLMINKIHFMPRNYLIINL
jgi:hypothetical protein